jgi:hypothetical protein
MGYFYFAARGPELTSREGLEIIDGHSLPRVERKDINSIKGGPLVGYGRSGIQVVGVMLTHKDMR